MADNDAAFLWETEALRGQERAHGGSEGEARPPGRWATLREASAETTIPVDTLRKWARRGQVDSYLEETTAGQVRMVAMGSVLERAESLGREIPEPPAAATPDRPSREAAETRSVMEDPPPGTMLVPIDAWDKMLLQLGNLHEAGQQLAEARERAAKAETEAHFLKERLGELRAQLADSGPPRADVPVEPPAGSPEHHPLSHIPIETDDDSSDDEDVLVRDLKPAVEPTAHVTVDEESDDEMTITAYSLEMMKHLYSTWRGRPRR